MNELLVYFALPIATIILSIVLQKVLKSPLLVSATTFAVFLVVTFAVYDVNFLVNTVIYTFISYISAVFSHLMCNYKKCEKHDTFIIKGTSRIQDENINKIENKKCNCLCGRR